MRRIGSDEETRICCGGKYLKRRKGTDEEKILIKEEIIWLIFQMDNPMRRKEIKQGKEERTVPECQYIMVAGMEATHHHGQVVCLAPTVHKVRHLQQVNPQVNTRPTVGQQSANSRPTVGQHSANSRPKVGQQLANSRPTVGQQSANSRPKVGQHSANSRPTVRQQSANSPPTVGQQSANSRPSVGQQSANSRPTVGQQSANSRPTVRHLHFSIKKGCKP